MKNLQFLRAVLTGIGLGLSGWGACAAGPGSVLEAVRDSGVLKVCIWPDYYGITLRHPRTQQLSGLDIDLSAHLARDLKVSVAYVDSSFPSVADDLKSGRCDVAMFGIAMLPQRMTTMRFSRPYLQSDIYAVTSVTSQVVKQWSDIDRPGVLVGVQAGTFMEAVMGNSLRAARLVRVSPPTTRERELEAGRVDVFMTDYAYSRRLLDTADWARLVSPPTPFHVLPYGYAVRLNDEPWWQVVDQFVERIQRDGRLASTARQHGLSAIVRLK